MARHHVAGVSIKIASITEKTELNFSIERDAQLNVLKSQAAVDLERPKYSVK